MRRKLSTLTLALIVSVGIHGALLTVRLVAPDHFNRIFQDTPLEVVLVNARGSAAPEQAQAIAQVNLAGGGDAPSGRATSPLPAAPRHVSGDSHQDTPQRVEALQRAQQLLLAQLRHDIAALDSAAPQPVQAEPDAPAEPERRRQLVDLLAEIEKRINAENTRPRRRFISPATREAVYALYYDQLRRKIEARGTRSFPHSDGRKLYGELTMNVTIDATGHVIETDVVRGSTSKVLDRRAVAIVRAAAPFGAFSAPMQRLADQLVVTSRFRFTRDAELETTLTAPAGATGSAAAALPAPN